jgi:hypothetical protein
MTNMETIAKKYNGMTKAEAVFLALGIGEFNKEELNEKYGGETEAYQKATEFLIEIGAVIDGRTNKN